MICINTSHQEFQSLLKETGKSSFELELDVAAWQQTKNTDLFPTAQELYPDTFDNKVIQIKNAIKKLPIEIANAVTVVKDVSLEILGRKDLFLSLKEILNENNITSEILINWTGLNKDKIGLIKEIKSEEALLDRIQSLYNKKKDPNNYEELQRNDLALESFNKWKKALEKYPIAFQDIMLTHAVKYLKPERRDQYVLQLSPVALSNTYSILLNQPHEANRLGKLYDKEVLATVSDATEHEPSASGNGYWVHIPRTDSESSRYLGFKTYAEFQENKHKDIERINGYIANYKRRSSPEYLDELVSKIQALESKTPTFFKQETHLTREEADKYGFQDFDYVRTESTYSRWDKNRTPQLIIRNQPHIEYLGEDYEGYYIHGYNTDSNKPSTKILPISKREAEELWKREVESYPLSAYEVGERNDLLNLKSELASNNVEFFAQLLKEEEKKLKEIEDAKESDWDSLTTEDDFKANVELLRKLSPSTWCTASGMADSYVQNYDNYLLIVNGLTVAGIEAYPKVKTWKSKPTITSITKQEYEAAVEDSFNNLLGEFTEDGKTYYVDVAENIRYSRRGEIYQKQEHELDSTAKRDVKENTSRANNGISSIEHYDDIYAFFEKHNLNPNNESLIRAKQYKDAGKTDKDINTEDWYYEQAEEDYWEERDVEYDVEPPDFYDNAAGMVEYAIEEIDKMETIEQALWKVETDESLLSYFVYFPQEYKDNEVLANKAIDFDPHNIVHIHPAVLFYEELLTKAVTRSPNVFNYLPDNVKDTHLQLRAIYDAYEVAQAQTREREMYDDLPFSKTNANQIQGYYDPLTDKVVVVASNTLVDEAPKVAIHEVAHRGMLRLAKELGGERELGRILSSAKTQLMEKLPELLKRTGHTSLENLMLDYGFDEKSEEGQFKLLQELAARWAETLLDKPKPIWWKELLQNIKNWIKEFIGKTLNEQEVDELVGGFVKYGTEALTDEINIVPLPEDLNDFINFDKICL